MANCQEFDLDQELLRLSIHVAGLAARTDRHGSSKIQDVLIKLQQSLETPWETLMRYYDLVLHLPTHTTHGANLTAQSGLPTCGHSTRL